MRVVEFDFELPEELIAQQPPAERGASRMLCLDRQTGSFEDRWFRELPELLHPGDLLVLNDTRVLPARLYATRTGLRTQAGSPAPAGVVEVLLTGPASGGGLRWKALVKPAKKVVVGERLLFAEVPGGEPLLRAEVVAEGEFGERTLDFEVAVGWEFHAVLERIGHLPLPPYIRRERGVADSAEDRERYQTVYSRRFVRIADAGEKQIPFGDDRQKGNGKSNGKSDGNSNGEKQIPFGDDRQKDEGRISFGNQKQTQIPFGNDKQRAAVGLGTAVVGSGTAAVGSGTAAVGSAAAAVGSAAAPTAGLHFTPEILGQLRARGIEVAYVTLHVGLGTFQPVRVEDTREIRLHAEPYTLPGATAEALNRAWAEGRRAVAVGTTTTRTLEHVARQFEAEHGALSDANPLHLEAHSGSTGLFLSPAPDGDAEFKLVGALVTNFHLPQSTLLMLVSAFAGKERVLAAYRHAVETRYRFFSYGDCMLIA